MNCQEDKSGMGIQLGFCLKSVMRSCQTLNVYTDQLDSGGVGERKDLWRLLCFNLGIWTDGITILLR